MNDIARRVNDFKNDDRHGASQLLIIALEILRDGTDLAFCQDREMSGWLHRMALEMAESRGSMVNISNGLGQYRRLLQQAAGQSASLAEFRSNCRLMAEGLIKHVQDCGRTLAENASGLIKPGAVIMTCSYSSSVLKTLNNAHGRGTPFEVRAAESIGSGCSFGILLKEALDRDGIGCRIIRDSSLAAAMSDTTIVLIGADSLFTDGTLINGFPSLELAMAAFSHQPSVPVWTVLETFKISHGPAPQTNEPGFQAIPCHFLRGAVTDVGKYESWGDLYRTLDTAWSRLNWGK